MFAASAGNEQDFQERSNTAAFSLELLMSTLFLRVIE